MERDDDLPNIDRIDFPDGPDDPSGPDEPPDPDPQLVEVQPAQVDQGNA